MMTSTVKCCAPPASWTIPCLPWIPSTWQRRGEHGLDGMDWLDLTMGGERGEETSTLAPLCSQTPPSVFSTDFLDSSDLPIHWDSCL
uniref:Uncharacterized protein n=1 Tax=Cyclopterus lumpus TaxID=8103 RepID=A0A8C2ZFU3_CYCLU